MVMARKREKKEKDIIDQMLDNIDLSGLTQDEVVGQGGLIKQLTGRILQKALEAEMTEHLGYEKNSNAGDNSGNSRNGHTEKTVLLENQSTTVEVPRDRNGTFDPIIVPKHEKRLPIFNDQIISMYSFGMTDRDISGFSPRTLGKDIRRGSIAGSDKLRNQCRVRRSEGMAKPSFGEIIRDSVFRRATGQR
jgi:transposase-like protein